MVSSNHEMILWDIQNLAQVREPLQSFMPSGIHCASQCLLGCCGLRLHTA